MSRLKCSELYFLSKSRRSLSTRKKLSEYFLAHWHTSKLLLLFYLYHYFLFGWECLQLEITNAGTNSFNGVYTMKTQSSGSYPVWENQEGYELFFWHIDKTWVINIIRDGYIKSEPDVISPSPLCFYHRSCQLQYLVSNSFQIFQMEFEWVFYGHNSTFIW